MVSSYQHAKHKQTHLLRFNIGKLLGRLRPFRLFRVHVVWIVDVNGVVILVLLRRVDAPNIHGVHSPIETGQLKRQKVVRFQLQAVTKKAASADAAAAACAQRAAINGQSLAEHSQTKAAWADHGRGLKRRFT